MQLLCDPNDYYKAVPTTVSASKSSAISEFLSRTLPCMQGADGEHLFIAVNLQVDGDDCNIAVSCKPPSSYAVII